MTAKFFKSNGFKFYGAKMVIDGHWRTRWYFKPHGATGYALVDLASPAPLKRADVENFLMNEAAAKAVYATAFPPHQVLIAGEAPPQAQRL